MATMRRGVCTESYAGVAIDTGYGHMVDGLILVSECGLG